MPTESCMVTQGPCLACVTKALNKATAFAVSKLATCFTTRQLDEWYGTLDTHGDGPQWSLNAVTCMHVVVQVGVRAGFLRRSADALCRESPETQHADSLARTSARPGGHANLQGLRSRSSSKFCKLFSCWIYCHSGMRMDVHTFLSASCGIVDG